MFRITFPINQSIICKSEKRPFLTTWETIFYDQLEGLMKITLLGQGRNYLLTYIEQEMM